MTLNHPKAQNANTHKMREELLHLYRGVNHNDDVHVIVATGSGRVFCAGMNLNEGFTTEELSGITLI